MQKELINSTVKGIKIPIPELSLQGYIVKKVQEIVERSNMLKKESNEIVLSDQNEIEKLLLGVK